MKQKENVRLIKLYLAYHLNKTFIVLLSLVLIFLVGVLFINLGLPLDHMEYFSNKSFIHINYLEQSLYIINILNSIIVASLIGNEINSISSFDPMFVSNTNRRKIINAKIITNFILITIILLFEMVILFLLGIIFYPDFIITIKELILMPYQLLYLFELIIIGELLAIIFNNFFTTIFIFLISFLFNIVSKIENIKNYVYMMIPFIEFKSINNYSLNGNIFIYMLLNMTCYLLIQVIYQKKDIQ